VTGVRVHQKMIISVPLLYIGHSPQANGFTPSCRSMYLAEVQQHHYHLQSFFSNELPAYPHCNKYLCMLTITLQLAAHQCNIWKSD